MESYKILPQDIISMYDEDLGFVGEITGEQMSKGAPKWTGEIGLGDTVHTDLGERRIVELTVSFANPGSTVTKYKVVLGVYPKQKK